MTSIKLKIADIIIELKSKFRLKPYSKYEKRKRAPERLKNFFYHGKKKKADIKITVNIVDRFPKIEKTRPVFITCHFQDGSENWRLLKKGDTYVFQSPLKTKNQLMLISRDFDRVTAYLLSGEDRAKAWRPEDIVYDFIQVLLINYFALHKKGIFVHGAGLKDINGSGLVFAGKSGAGKSTTARIWHRFSRAMILNDDRIILRRQNGEYFIYSSPWHGDFSDYLCSAKGRAPLQRLFFIRHAPDNHARRITQKEAFRQLYPALFPTFWDKQKLENIVSFCQQLINRVPCYALGFRNNQKVISFVRDNCQKR
ncbi:hypothetical protein ACFLZ3_04065 [Candidatus Omnitrophota bacterium]